MSLGITPSEGFNAPEAAAEHLLRKLGSPAMFAANVVMSSGRRHADPSSNLKYTSNPPVDVNESTHQAVSSTSSLNESALPAAPSIGLPRLMMMSNSPPTRSLNPAAGKGARAPLKLVVDVGEASMRDSKNVPRDDDATNYKESSNTAKRVTDDILSLVHGLEKAMLNFKSRGFIIASAATSLEDVLPPVAAFANPRTSAAPLGSSERPVSCLSLSSHDGEPSTAKRLPPTPQGSESPPQRTSDEGEFAEFQPLGHDLESMFCKRKSGCEAADKLSSAANTPQPTSRRGARDVCGSPPWGDHTPLDDRYNSDGKSQLSEPSTIDDCLATIDEVRRAAVRAHRCVMDEVYEARQSVISLRQKLDALSKAHDNTVQRLLAANTKVSTTMTMLQEERSALQSVLLKFAQQSASSPTGRRSDTKIREHCVSSSAICQPPVADTVDASQFFRIDEVDAFEEEDDFDDDELFGAPSGVSVSASGSPKFCNEISETLELTPEQAERQSRVIATLMLPHEMANDMLKSRRQLQLYIRLISQLPSALQEHHDMIERRFQQNWLAEAESLLRDTDLEKERMLESARLLVSGEL